MDARFNGFDGIIQALGLGNTKSLQVWYNKYLQGKETDAMNIEGFGWDMAQIDFAYELGEIFENITAMATYVDLNSEPLPRGREIEIRKFGGMIPRQKRLEVFGENDYRRWLIAAQQLEGVATLRGESPYNSLLDYFAENLLNRVSEFPTAHGQSLTYQVGQMKSNPDGLVLTADNNQSGIIGINFKSNIPAENVRETYYYKDDADGTVASYEDSKNPFEDSRKFVKALKYDGTYGNVTLEIDKENTFYKLVRHPAFQKAIGYMTIGGLYVAGKTNSDADERAMEAGNWALLTATDEQIKEWFKRLMGVDEVIYHNNVVFAPKLNPETKKFDYIKMKAFNTGVMLYRPSGQMGTIKNVTPLRPDGQAIVASIFGGRGIIEYRYDRETRTQTWVSELTALAVPSQPRKMYIFKVGDESEVSKLLVKNNGLPLAEAPLISTSTAPVAEAPAKTTRASKSNATE